MKSQGMPKADWASNLRRPKATALARGSLQRRGRALLLCVSVTLSVASASAGASLGRLRGGTGWSSTPRRLMLGSGDFNVTSGDAHSCASVAGYGLVCWGKGQYGRLGYGNTADIGDDEEPFSAGTVQLGPGVESVSVGAGREHTCVVLSSGGVMCWGNGLGGRLGYGNTDFLGDNETPASVGTLQLGSGETALQVSCSVLHTCAVFVTGGIKCWGLGSRGRLGYGNTVNIGDDEHPETVGYVNLGSFVYAAQVTTGADHSCALLTSGKVKCWGWGRFGHLGIGNTDDIGDDETPFSSSTVQLGAGVTVAQVAAGSEHTCALLTDGNIMCWGFGGNGQLGYGNSNNVGDAQAPSTAGTVPLGTGVTATHIDAGHDHTCVVLSDGGVKCWGDSTFGQLGYSNTNNVGKTQTPAAVGSVQIGTGVTAERVTLGQWTSCATLTDGGLLCWGSGREGRLGYGNTDSIGNDEHPAAAGRIVFVAPSASPSPTPSSSVTPSATASATPTTTPSATPSASSSAMPSASAPASPSASPTVSAPGSPASSGGSQSDDDPLRQPGPIAGIAIACLVVLGILAFLVFRCCCSKGDRQVKPQEQVKPESSPEPAEGEA